MRVLTSYMRPLWECPQGDTQRKADVHENVDIRFEWVTLENKEKCPGSDSNRHCMGFESIACCQLGYRGPVNPRLTSTHCLTTIPQLGTLLGAVPACPYQGAHVSAPESPQPVDVPEEDKSHVPPMTTRVVIAEDEALIRLDLKEMLEEEGYTVVGEAGDGEQAVELAREHRPDLVILDVKMPKLDGISAAEKIAEESIAPVLMLTAFSQRDLVERARDAGAMAYLVKPFSKTDVVPAIEMAVSRFTELKELEKEVADLTLRLETRKLVDRAKSILQTEYGLSEPAAFRWIQKTSMDRRMSMQQVAEAVIQDADEKKANKG